MKNIFIIGFMGVGKTFFGSNLSKYIKVIYLDIDYVITYLYNIKIINIFLDRNFFLFRKLEKNFLNFAKFKKNLLISCGGGVIIDKINILRINLNFCFCIILNKVFLFKSINKNNRPMLKKKNFFVILNKRKDIYKNSSKFYIKNNFNNEKNIYKFLNTL
ncbi:hypothetical protein ONB67_00685 [Candidatus Vidania fulgoroideae]|uniref:Shikimate kinase n=1 Tax=Candidatus Vidania fulgoroideorum TaxID=881286 RepID=A0AAX3NA46_9PROT|nr:hypothetical protein ONB67_00685 [Candidatus Vidania fulgoroideae]